MVTGAVHIVNQRLYTRLRLRGQTVTTTVTAYPTISSVIALFAAFPFYHSYLLLEPRHLWNAVPLYSLHPIPAQYVQAMRLFWPCFMRLNPVPLHRGHMNGKCEYGDVLIRIAAFSV
jgi:hypothetical protein